MAKRQRRDPEREAFWRRALARFGKSGLSVRGFCAAEKLSEPSFYSWRRVIQGRDRVSKPSRPAFVPVVVSNAPSDGGGGDAFVIELRDGHVLRLPRALPVRQVAELVCAIEAAPAPAPAPGSVAMETRP